MVTQLTEDCVIPSNQALPGLLDAGPQLPDHVSLMVSVVFPMRSSFPVLGLFF